MQLDHMPASRVLMQPVGVLRRNRGEVTGALESGERVVAGIRTGGKSDTASFFRDLPVGGRVGHEIVERSDFDRVELGPQSAFATKSWDSAFS
jgi:hypothetical protein